MNILIVSNVRCGGHYFMTQLSKKYNLESLHEPDTLVVYDNLCVKLLSDWPIKDVNEIVNYSKKFDYVFLLDRKNIDEQFKSIYTISESTKNMSVPWKWDDSHELQKDYYQKEKLYKEWLSNKSNNLKKISKILKNKIIYYEDLYYDTKNCNLKGLEFIPDISKKLRSSTYKELQFKKNII